MPAGAFNKPPLPTRYDNTPSSGTSSQLLNKYGGYRAHLMQPLSTFMQQVGSAPAGESKLGGGP